jgi:hypothetical protein
VAEILQLYLRASSVSRAPLAIAVAGIGASRARQDPRRDRPVVLVAALFFGVCYAVARPLATFGRFDVPAMLRDPAYDLLFLFGGSTLLFGLA